MKKILFLFFVFYSLLSIRPYCFGFMDEILMDSEPAPTPTKRDSLISAFGSGTKQKATEPKSKKQEATKQEFFYPFVSGDLDTTDSCWYDDKVYLLVVKVNKKAVITILPYGFRFYEGSFSPRNGFEKKVRETKTDIICWGQGSQVANPRAYFFVEPKGTEPYQIYIQKAIDDKVSDPILYTFRKAVGEQSTLSTTKYMGGNKGGTAPQSPPNRVRLSK